MNTDLNIINLARKGHQGLSNREAMGEVGFMMESCYQRWYWAFADMPVWSEKIDSEVLHFVNVCRDMALGGLYWRYALFAFSLLSVCH